MTHDPHHPPAPPGDGDDLQFDRAERAAPPPPGVGEPVAADATMPGAPGPGVTACGACGEPIADTYFEANGKIVCPRCRDAVLASQAQGAGIGGIIGAVLLGTLAGAVGAAVWYGVRALSNTEWSLIAIGVALLVGAAIRFASGGRGGVIYQVLAVLITYLAICANYIPDVYAALTKNPEAVDVPMALLLLSSLTISLQLPFLMGTENILGLIIIGIGLWFAWKTNRRSRLTFNGPYRLAPGAGVAPPAPLPQA